MAIKYRDKEIEHLIQLIEDSKETIFKSTLEENKRDFL